MMGPATHEDVVSTWKDEIRFLPPTKRELVLTFTTPEKACDYVPIDLSSGQPLFEDPIEQKGCRPQVESSSLKELPRSNVTMRLWIGWGS
jgi:hypothetical protein